MSEPQFHLVQPPHAPDEYEFTPRVERLFACAVVFLFVLMLLGYLWWLLDPPGRGR